MKKTSILSFLVVSLFFTGAAHAGNWVDDWFQQATYSGAESFEGQKRGYWTGGNMSVRFNTSSDSLVTASLPKIKAGCGGIDAFMGGFSFLNMDKLGDKFQGIMTGAASYAFDLALETVCAQCSKIYKDLEVIADKLNSIQLDDCKAGKALVTYAADKYKNGGSITEDAVQEVGEIYQGSGIKDLYTDAKDEIKKDPPKTTAGNVKSEVTNGDADLTALLYTKGSFLGKVAQKYNIDSKWMDLARGYIGDLYTIEDDNPAYATNIAPCPQNNLAENYADLVNGTGFLRGGGSADDTCVQAAGSDSVRSYVSKHMDAVVNAAKNKSLLPSDTKTFISRSTIPAYLNIISFIVVNDPGAVENLKDKFSTLYAIKQFTDLYENVTKALETYQSLVEKKARGKLYVMDYINKAAVLQANIKKNMDVLSVKLHEARKEYLDDATARVNMIDSAQNNSLPRNILKGQIDKAGGN
ncbi:MAG: conjugal transfer protein TraH [Deltaproteobacteria bacterium]|nr:conjugal transfer protein TraH [Deltaproteobacteria bacterium]